jgi:hypothetical protein
LRLKVGWVTQKSHSSNLLPAARGINDRVKRRTRPAPLRALGREVLPLLDRQRMVARNLKLLDQLQACGHARGDRPTGAANPAPSPLSHRR